MIKVVKVLFTSVLIAIIVTEAYMIFLSELNFGNSHILLILIMIFLLLYRSKLTWGILFVICIYGVFDFFDATHKSAPTFMDFTATLSWYFFYGGSSNMIFRRILIICPLFFYLRTSITIIANYFKGYDIKS